MNSVLDEIRKNVDLAYGDFTAKLIPNIEREKILGLRAPVARKIARSFAKSDEGSRFLSSLPHKYHDEYMVHTYMLGCLPLSFDELKDRIEAFLPFVDNWAVCDSLCAAIKKFFIDKDLTLDFVRHCLKSNKAYTVRFGIVCLLNYYIDEKYIDMLCNIVKAIKSEEYYINMALAWLISFMLIKEYEKTLPLLIDGVLDPWVHNKSISKFLESLKPTNAQKAYLKTLRR